MEDYYQRNRIAIYNLRVAFPHEEVQRELDFISEVNENIYSRRETVPNIVLMEELELLYDNMNLRINLTRAEFLKLTGL